MEGQKKARNIQLGKEKQKWVALKHGQGSTYYDIKWVKAPFSSTLARRALFFFFSFSSLVFGYDSNLRPAQLLPLAALQYSSCSMNQWWRCQQGCVWHSVPRPWFPLRQLEESPIWTPVSLFHVFSQHGGWDWGCVPWASGSPRKAKTGQATWC